jgi:hypothetical protein
MPDWTAGEMHKAATMSETPARYPAVRGALWLYVLVMLGTSLVLGMQSNIESFFLRLAVAILIVGGGTFAAIIITQIGFAGILGRAPGIRNLLLGLLAGVLLWLPVAWLMLVTDGLLVNAIGPLSLPKALDTGATQAAVIVQFGLVVPLCQGLLFWAYLQRAGEGIERVGGALIGAALFGLYSLVSEGFGLRGLPAYLVIGLAAAFAGYFTGSAWSGMAVLIGYSLTRAVFENTQLQANLFVWLGADTPEQLLGARWLLAVAFSAFIVFALLQVIRAMGTRDTTGPRAEPRRLWWLPLLVSLAFCVWLGYSELAVRATNRRLLTESPSDSGSTAAPPLIVTATPTPTP